MSNARLPFELIESGDGPIVVLVHGSASDRRTWVDTRQVLSESSRVVAYSRRYHWPNDPPNDDDDYSMSAHVDDLLAVIATLDGGPVDLVGHSYGGFVALLAAMREPAVVRSMILIEPPVVSLFVSTPPRPTQILKLLVTRPRLAVAIIGFGIGGIGPATKAAERGDMNGAIDTFGPAVLGREAFDQLSVSRWQQVKANNIRAEYTGSGFPSLNADAVRAVETPTLLVTGTRSPRLWPMLVAELGALLPNSEVVEIADASHLVHEDSPAAFDAAALEFLARHR